MFKSILGFENWTKKMSKSQKRKHFPAFFFDVTRKFKNRGFIFIFQMKINNKKAIDHLNPYHKTKWIPYESPPLLSITTRFATLRIILQIPISSSGVMAVVI